MNTRIDYLSEKAIKLKFSNWGLMRISVHPDATEIDGALYDDDGLRALLDVIHCKLDTGDLGALRDDSDRPFVGKRMRCFMRGHPELATPCVVEVQYKIPHRQPPFDKETHWYCYQVEGGIRNGVVESSGLLPLTAPEPAKPKIRPYTPVEAAAHLGRVILNGTYRYILSNVGINTVYISGGYGNLSLDCFAERFTWDDDGSPCGVEE